MSPIEEQKKLEENREKQDEKILLDFEIQDELQWLESEVQTKWIRDIVNTINEEEDFHITSEKLNIYVKNKERGKAIKEIFNIIGRLFWEKSWTGFKEFKTIEIEWENINITTLSKEKLEQYILYMKSNILKTQDIKKDLKFTYILSKIKNQLTKINEPWTTMSDYELFSKNIQPGSIILFNKKTKKRDIGADLLKAYDEDFDTDFIHSGIVSDIEKNWAINILHATTDDYQKSWGKWGIRKEPLKKYFERWWVESCDFLVLEPNENNRKKMLTYAQANIGKWYDNNAAIWWWLYNQDLIWPWFSTTKWNDDVFNCVEIIAKWLDVKWIENITHPNQFLEFMEQLQPSYMTTIQNKEIK